MRTRPEDGKYYYRNASLLTIFIIFLGIVGLVVYVAIKSPTSKNFTGSKKLSVKQETKFDKFTSQEDFKKYLASFDSSYSSGLFARDSVELFEGGAVGFGAGENIALSPSFDITSPRIPQPTSSRYSQTNVQVLGIDEPDVVKTDGDNIYYSGPFNSVIQPFPSVDQPEIGRIQQPTVGNGIDYYFPPSVNETKVISANPSSPTELADIDLSGDLLLANDTLIVLTARSIKAFDVSNSSSPSEKWEVDLADDNSLVSSRLYGDEIFVLTQKAIKRDLPCPYDVTGDLVVRCLDIYHPVSPIEVNTTYTLVKLDAASGRTKDSVSFVGSYNTVTYMSEESFYVAYSYQESFADFLVDFLTGSTKGILPDSFISRVFQIDSYDISESSKVQEITTELYKYFDGLEKDQRRKTEESLQDAATNYTKEHARDLVKTGIAKISVDDLEIDATSGVPGVLHNQFSLDEYNGNLRIATTTDARSVYGISNLSSFNDIYVLNSKLEQIGSVLDLGITERVYSSRFVGDLAYLVTFRQIDPFYVIDLSDPKNPKMVGELKIPGFSSYLHPINKNLILGVGEERNTDPQIDIIAPSRFQSVKVSLFDVSDPSKPSEVTKLYLDDSWSEVGSNHHAFLIDEKHKVFFMPAGDTGYIVSYDQSRLTTVKTIQGVNANRAVFVDNYLYILGSEKMVVLDENTWDQVGELNF